MNLKIIVISLLAGILLVSAYLWSRGSFKANSENLAGVDKNSNWIRDDIESFISSQYGSSEKLKLGLMQFALTQQQAILSETAEQSINVLTAQGRALECLSYLEAPGEAWQKISELIINTPERRRAWKAHESRLSGIVFESHDIRQWKLSCTFDPDLLPERNFADWQTYRNNKYGFEVKYPGKYTACNEDYEGFITSIGESINKEYPACEATIYFSGIWILLEEKPITEIRDDYINKFPLSFRESTFLGDGLSWSIFQYELGGKDPWPVGIPETEIPLGIYQVAVTYKNNLGISVARDPTTVLEDIDFKKILSTFKFIK